MWWPLQELGSLLLSLITTLEFVGLFVEGKIKGKKVFKIFHAMIKTQFLWSKNKNTISNLNSSTLN